MDIEFVWIIFKYSVPTLQKTHCVLITKNNRLTLYGEVFVVYCGNHAEDMNKLRGQHGEFLEVKLGGTCDNELISTMTGAWGPSQNVPFPLSVGRIVLRQRKYGFTDTSNDSSCAQKHNERHTLYYAWFHCDELTWLLPALQNSVIK